MGAFCFPLNFYLHNLLSEHEQKLAAVMKFLTGSHSAPPLGFARKMDVAFRHGCFVNCTCKIVVSTCDLCLTLPVHYNKKEQFIEVIFDAIKLAGGFHKL